MDNADRLELVRQMFAQITMVFEDAATLAVDGQGRLLTAAQLRELADTLQEYARRAEALSTAVLILLDPPPGAETEAA